MNSQTFLASASPSTPTRLYAGKLSLTNLRGVLRHNEPLAAHTTWRVGGPAEWFYEPADLEDLMALLPQLPPEMPIFWLGLGSNLLVRDGGIRGMVILTANLVKDMSLLDESVVRVEAGVPCAKVARFSVKHHLSGAEFLIGVPGTMGGALAMNAGAFGGDTWSLVVNVETLDRQGELHRRAVHNYQVGYRSVKGPVDEWFVSATLRLVPHHPEAQEQLQEKLKELLRWRSEKQPVGLPSCGSVFRNPPGDYAARLIEQTGWKGKFYGGAYVSEKHANFIINQQATAAEIELLIQQIQETVERQTGIRLIPEVKMVGDAK